MRVGGQVPLHDVLSSGRRKKVRWIRHGLNRGSLYRILIGACRIVPRRVLYVIADHVASRVVHRAVPELRRVIASNLRPIDPSVPPLRVLRAYSRNLLDTIHLSRAGGVAPASFFEDDPIGDERLRRALAAGRGAILVSPHLGNWDIGCRSLEIRGFRFHVVAQPEADATVDAFRRRSRQGREDRTIEAGSAMQSFFRVRAALDGRGLVLMLGDRALPGDAVSVTFFGRRALFPRAPAALAHLTGAPIVPAAFVRAGDGLFRGLSSDPLFPPRDATDRDGIARTAQAVARAFEGFVREYPEQWFNFYPFWEEDLA